MRTIASHPKFRLAWPRFAFMTACHLAAAFAVVYLSVIHFSWWTLGFGLLWSVFCGLSITGGYHRLFAHGAYRAHAVLRVFYLLFGAAALQNSALAWAADHRAHHAHTDQDGDPYDIRRGFWWAHIGWILHDDRTPRDYSRVQDLLADRWVRLQHRHYLPLSILFGLVLPAAIGCLWSDPLGAVLVAGLLRLVCLWHATFSINSFTHTLGRQTYTLAVSARDSMLVALITLGEGYHNFHHRFQIDYRNGVRWYNFDPTKWWIWSAKQLGLASHLRRIPRERIEAARAAVRAGSACADAPMI